MRSMETKGENKVTGFIKVRERKKAELLGSGGAVPRKGCPRITLKRIFLNFFVIISTLKEK